MQGFEEKCSDEDSRVKYIKTVEALLFDAPKKPELVESALAVVGERLAAKYAFFLSWQTGHISLIWRQGQGCVQSEMLLKRFAELFRIVDERGRVMTDNVQELLQSDQERDSLTSLGVRDVMAVIASTPMGRHIGILGVAGMACGWSDTQILDDVVLNFAAAAVNLETYQDIKLAGMKDQLTELRNQTSFLKVMEELERTDDLSLACIYIDVNGLHEVNNSFGHAMGDHMLKAIAEAIRHEFGSDMSYRIGGDEFVAFCSGMDQAEIDQKIRRMQETVAEHDYHISVGTAYREKIPLVCEMIQYAEKEMYEAKRLYYAGRNDEQQMRAINYRLEKILMEKRDLDAFRYMLSSKYFGVYIVNLSFDSMRSIYIPSYFAEIFERAQGKFSRAMRMYIEGIAAPADQEILKRMCDYDWLDERLQKEENLSLQYQRTDGKSVLLKIRRLPGYSELRKECIWSFEPMENMET